LGGVKGAQNDRTAFPPEGLSLFIMSETIIQRMRFEGFNRQLQMGVWLMMPTGGPGCLLISRTTIFNAAVRFFSAKVELFFR